VPAVKYLYIILIGLSKAPDICIDVLSIILVFYRPLAAKFHKDNALYQQIVLL
jgi:hypothetical protein